MTRHMILMVASGAATLAATTTVDAAVLEIRTDLSREVRFLDPGSPEAAAGFQLGESVTMEFTFDSTIANSSTNPDRGLFLDPNATYRLIGNTSGAVLDYAPGLRIRLTNDANIQIASLANPADALNTPVLAGLMRWETSSSRTLFSDVKDLSQVFEDLFATTFETTQGPIASTSFWDGTGHAVGMRMAGPPAGASFTLIPSPSTVAMLGLAGLVGVRRRR